MKMSIVLVNSMVNPVNTSCRQWPSPQSPWTPHPCPCPFLGREGESVVGKKSVVVVGDVQRSDAARKTEAAPKGSSRQPASPCDPS